jgi:hypothetical protein
MSKMGSCYSFEYLNTSYGKKKGQKSKCQFDSWPLKVENHPDLIVQKWHATYRWKVLAKGYSFSLNFTSIEGLHKKLWAFQVAKVPISKISRLSTRELQDKMTFGCNPVVNHKKYYKREATQVHVVVNLVSSCMFMVHVCTKSAPTTH